MEELTRLGGYLPLAVGMLASQLRHHPVWSATRLATELAGAKDRLAPMHAENLSVAAAFDLSFADLTAGPQRLFRRLGLVPGPSFDAYAAAALDDASLTIARRNLDDLYDQHLIAEPAPGRYQLHDLLREHARRWPLPATPPDRAPRPIGCWITTCTPCWPPAGTFPPGLPPTAGRMSAGPATPRICPRPGGTDVSAS